MQGSGGGGSFYRSTSHFDDLAWGAIWLRIATAMSEILVGTVAQLAIGAFVGGAALGVDQSWIKFLASTGAILLTFLAGAELDPAVLRSRWKETTTVGLVAFFAPFSDARYFFPWRPILVSPISIGRTLMLTATAVRSRVICAPPIVAGTRSLAARRNADRSLARSPSRAIATTSRLGSPTFTCR